MPWGSAISTAPPESYKFPSLGGDARQTRPPEVLPWDDTGPPLPEEDPPALHGGRTLSPPPPPLISSAPAESQDAPPSPPPAVMFGPSARETERLEGSARKRSKSKNKMPKGESEDGELILQGKRVRRHRVQTTGESETAAPAYGGSTLSHSLDGDPSAGLPRQPDDQADLWVTKSVLDRFRFRRWIQRLFGPFRALCLKLHSMPLRVNK